MSIKRYLNRRKANEEKKAAEKQARQEKATKTREVPADQVPEIAEANPLVIKRRQLLLKEQEALLKQLDFIGVALQEQTNAVCMAAGIDPTGKLVNWTAEGDTIIITKAPAQDQANGQAQAPEAKAEEPAPEQSQAPSAPASNGEATTTLEALNSPEATGDDLVVNLEELGQAIKNN
jgi:hypothetical protein